MLFSFWARILLTINKDIYNAIKILHSQLIYPSVILDIVLYFNNGKKFLVAVQTTDQKKKK